MCTLSPIVHTSLGKFHFRRVNGSPRVFAGWQNVKMLTEWVLDRPKVLLRVLSFVCLVRRIGLSGRSDDADHF